MVLGVLARFPIMQRIRIYSTTSHCKSTHVNQMFGTLNKLDGNIYGLEYVC